MLQGVMGKTLWVDLTRGVCTEERVPEEVYGSYLSGIGLAAHYLYRRVPPGADPLGPDNILAFVAGLLTGTGSLMTGRWMVAAKSPLTGGWGEANAGGMFAPAIKQAGYDGIFFSGASPEPVYLVADHSHAELRDASGLWGQDTVATEAQLRQDYPGKEAQVACIGQAGERRSLISGIVNEGGRIAARSGLGAVMGAKRLKAIVLVGAHRIPVARPSDMQRLTTGFLKAVGAEPPLPANAALRWFGIALRVLPLTMRQDGLLYKFMLQKWGTIALNQFSIECGDAPVRNWGGSNADFGAERHSAFNADRILVREEVKYHCYACPVGCGGICSHPVAADETHKPEYETVTALGALLMNSDLDAVFAMNDRLNRAGMDSISAGGVLAFAIECFENGLLSLEETGGLELRWGNAPAIAALVDRMITREGLGDVLADGVRVAARRIGRGAERYAVHAGGQEPGMHDSRNDPGYGLHYAVEPAPGRHTTGSLWYYEMYRLWRKVPGLPPPPPQFYPKGEKHRGSPAQAAMGAANSKFKMVVDCAGLCLFGAMLGVDRTPVFEWLNAATGWSKSPEEYMEMGRRVQSLRQAFNIRQGTALLHDVHGRIMGDPPPDSGANRGRSAPLAQLVPLYWAALGWDAEGRPPAEELSSFDAPPT